MELHDGDGEERLEPALEELRGRLAADIAAVLDAVGDVTQAQSEWRPAHDRWSIGEILHHLAISNRGFAVAVHKLAKRGRRDSLAAGLGSRRSWPRMRSIADAAASGPVKNPEFATPAAGLAIGELRRDLAATHAAVANQIPALQGLDFAALRWPHPLGFELNLFQWADIAGAHERRHLAQIRAVMSEPGFPST